MQLWCPSHWRHKSHVFGCGCACCTQQARRSHVPIREACHFEPEGRRIELGCRRFRHPCRWLRRQLTDSFPGLLTSRASLVTPCCELLAWWLEACGKGWAGGIWNHGGDRWGRGVTAGEGGGCACQRNHLSLAFLPVCVFCILNLVFLECKPF